MISLVSNTLAATWAVTGEMAPYLLLGCFVAGLMSEVVSTATVERHLGGTGWWPVIKASLFGVPLPLCSCGVIPVAASLRAKGASSAATVSFLISTPQTGIDSILVTLALLGPVVATLRPVAALVTGIVGGGLVLLFAPENRRDALAAMACKGGADGSAGTWWQRARRVVHYAFITVPGSLAGPMLLGVIVSGLITVLVPENELIHRLGSGWTGMLIALAVGIPMYVCATSSVPIAAALIAKGISPGVAMVFLLSGPATNTAAIATLWRVLGRSVTLMYLLVVAVGALAFGAGIDLWYPNLAAAMPMVARCHDHGATTGMAGSIWATILLVILIWPLWRQWQTGQQAHDDNAMPDAGETVLAVAGMSCQHCARAVEESLVTVPGVTACRVDLGRGVAHVQGGDPVAMRAVVEKLGYAVGEPRLTSANVDSK